MELFCGTNCHSQNFLLESAGKLVDDFSCGDEICAELEALGEDFQLKTRVNFIFPTPVSQAQARCQVLKQMAETAKLDALVEESTEGEPLSAIIKLDAEIQTREKVLQKGLILDESCLARCNP